MPTQSPLDLSAKFRALSRALRATYEAASVGGRHGIEKGLRHESALCDFLRAHLPPRYGVSRGEILDSTGRTSRQIDVVIYDALHAPLLQDTDASRVFPSECVYAAIELKTKLDARALEDAFLNISTAKALDRSAIVDQHGGHRIHHGPKRNPPLFGAIFALDSAFKPGLLAQRLLAFHSGLPAALWVDAVCVLDRTLLYHFALRTDARGVEYWSPTVLTDDARLGYYISKADTLYLFFLYLLFQMNAKDLFPPELMRYARMPDIPGPLIVSPPPNNFPDEGELPPEYR